MFFGAIASITITSAGVSGENLSEYFVQVFISVKNQKIFVFIQKQRYFTVSEKQNSVIARKHENLW